MIESMKRMVLTGAAVVVMMGLAAPVAMAQEVRDHRDGNGEDGPIVRDHRDGSGGILCSIFPASCEPPPYNVNDPVIPPVVNDPPDPVVDPPPKHCQFLPKGCKPPFGDDPVLDPGDGEDPVSDPPDNDDPVADPPATEDPVTDPPDKEDPVAEPDKNDPGNEESDPSGPGGSSGGTGSAGETIDQGGTFVSGFLPTTLTNAMGDAGNSIKKNLPSPVAKSLPNTGGGWSFLVLVAAGLIAAGLVIRSVTRSRTSVTRTAQ